MKEKYYPEICMNCKFWGKKDGYPQAPDGLEGDHECHRYLPSKDAPYTASWDWCGEFALADPRKRDLYESTRYSTEELAELPPVDWKAIREEARDWHNRHFQSTK